MASYQFIGDIVAAIACATELAGDGVVALNSVDVGGQALALGLVDEVVMDVVPVVFGSGKRFFGPVDGQHLLEDPHVVIQGDRVLRHRLPWAGVPSVGIGCCGCAAGRAVEGQR